MANTELRKKSRVIVAMSPRGYRSKPAKSRDTGIDEAGKRLISDDIPRLHALQNYPFTALEISSSVDEAQIADIFVRINSKRVTLTQADFILTPLSVFWDEGRSKLEDFCRAWGAGAPGSVQSTPSPHGATSTAQ